MVSKVDSEIVGRFVIHITPWLNPMGSCPSVRKGATREGKKTPERNVSVLQERSCTAVRALGWVITW